MKFLKTQVCQIVSCAWNISVFLTTCFTDLIGKHYICFTDLIGKHYICFTDLIGKHYICFTDLIDW